MEPWKTKTRHTVLNDHPWLTVEHHTVELPDGQILLNWPWIITPDYINVLAVTEDGHFICFRQVKYGIEGTTLGIVGGYVEEGEEPLAAALDSLSDDERWASFEASLNRCTTRVYDLTPECIRIDSTTASEYWKVSEEGLFQLGHSKDHCPDLPQLKVVLATLDPLGMPCASIKSRMLVNTSDLGFISFNWTR